MDWNQGINKFDIERFLKSHNIDYDDSNEQYYILNCINPNCLRENKLILNKISKQWKCFVCYSGWNLLDFISQVDGISKQQAWNLVFKDIEYIGDEVLTKKIIENTYHINPDEVVNLELKEIQLPYHFQSINLKDNAPQSLYLQNRGIDQEIVDLFELKFDPVSQRIIFLIYDHLERLVGWQGRDITDLSEIKAITKPNGFKKSLILFNYNQYLDEDTITLVEGPIDSVKGYQYNAVALLGKSLNSFQRLLLFANPNLKKIIIALDQDALSMSYSIAKELSLYYQVSIIEDYGNHKDLGGCSLREIDEIFNNLKPFNSEINLIGVNNDG